MNEDVNEVILIKITKAKNTFHEVNILTDNKLWNTAINRLYYACFYAVSALLTSIAVESKTHSGANQMFGLRFVKTGKIPEDIADIYSTLFHLRQSADYEYLVEYEEDDVMPLIEPAEKLIARIEYFLSANKSL